ncbi:MAG: putative fimbrial chaperone YehC [Candidatus Erwinia impunctatus]|nr:putative fimbrial chaperone YehC [Culicoides impunctatus]
MLRSLSALILLVILFPTVAFSSVIMTGTRIIYPADLKDKTIQLTNPDSTPYLVQLGLDNGENASNKNVPFIVTPQFFRIESNSGQSVRLSFVGAPLPQDRESLFFLTFTQLPAVSKSATGDNQLVLAITNRVKIFYRPSGIASSSEKIVEALHFKISGRELVVSNHSGFYATFRHVSGLQRGKKVVIASAMSAPPMSEARWALPATIANPDKLSLTMVNDYGVDVVSNIDL